MENLLSEIYDKVICQEPNNIQYAKKFDAIVEEMLEPIKERKTEAEAEEIKELIYKAAYFAEKYGFIMGVRFTGRFFAEIMEAGEA